MMALSILPPPIGDGELGIVIEVKYPDGGDLEKGCREALEQIERMGYEEKLRQDDIETVLKYGIACNRKKCRVVVRHQQQELRE